MIKLVAFDWNGTIFADTFAIYKSDNEVFKLLKIKPATFQAFQKYYDVPIKRFYLALGVSENEFDKKVDLIAQTFHTHYERLAVKVRSRAYARYILEWLSKNNITSVIFSNHLIEPIKKQLKRLKLDGYFSEIMANSHLKAALNRRDKKDRLKNYLANKNLLPNEVLIIGDTVEEIEIGQQLGISTTAITHGNCSTARLRAAQPDYLINSLKEVVGIMQG